MPAATAATSYVLLATAASGPPSSRPSAGRCGLRGAAPCGRGCLPDVPVQLSLSIAALSHGVPNFPFSLLIFSRPICSPRSLTPPEPQVRPHVHSHRSLLLRHTEMSLRVKMG